MHDGLVAHYSLVSINCVCYIAVFLNILQNDAIFNEPLFALLFGCDLFSVCNNCDIIKY